jgi:PAS domain S-box-containing protein
MQLWCRCPLLFLKRYALRFRAGEPQVLRGVSVSFPECLPQCFHFTIVPLESSELAMIGESPYKGFIDRSSDVFGVVSPDSHMLYRSLSSDTIFGFGPGETDDRVAEPPLDESGLEALQKAAEALRAAPDVPQVFEFKQQNKNGTWRDMEIIVQNFVDDPDVGGAIFNTRDISRRKAAERKVLALNEELEAYSYTVSHDLKTPLRLVSDILANVVENRKDVLPKEERAQLARADALLEDMTGLVRDLLSFSRTGSETLSGSTVDISSVARDIRSDLIQRDAIPHESIQVDDGLCCFGDPTLLRQVMANLLDNAVKFSRDNDPQIQVGGSSHGSSVRIFVRDNGVGFPPEQANQLFTVFRRLHQDISVPGTGVGLAIVKRIVERHGGRVWAEGNSGAGATLYVELPCEASDVQG